MITAIILWLSPLIIMYIALNLYDYLTNGSVSEGIKARSAARNQEKAHRDETHRLSAQVGNENANVVLQSSVRVDSVPTREHTSAVLDEIDSLMGRISEEPVTYTAEERQALNIADVNAMLSPTRERVAEQNETLQQIQRTEREREINEMAEAMFGPALTQIRPAVNPAVSQLQEPLNIDDEVDMIMRAVFGNTRPSERVRINTASTPKPKQEEPSAEPVVRKYRRITL